MLSRVLFQSTSRFNRLIINHLHRQNRNAQNSFSVIRFLSKSTKTNKKYQVGRFYLIFKFLYAGFFYSQWPMDRKVNDRS